MIQMNSMSLGLVKDKADDIEPKTAMNSDDLAALAGGVAANTGKIMDNEGLLATMSSDAMANSD